MIMKMKKNNSLFEDFPCKECKYYCVGVVAHMSDDNYENCDVYQRLEKGESLEYIPEIVEEKKED